MSNPPALRVVDQSMILGPLAEWSQWMSAGGMSPRTIDDRIQLVERLEDAAGSSLDLDWRALALFLAAAHFSAGTRQTYFAHFRAWYRWLLLEGYRADDPTIRLKSPRAPRRVPRPVTIEQLSMILRTRMHHRSRVMVLLGAYEGFRVSEIAKVRGEHLAGEVIRVIGKGGVDADVPLHPLIAELAAAMPATGYWFPSPVRPGPIAGKSVSTIISNVMRRAGVRATPHALRHFYGTETLRSSGGNLVVTQELMRHADVSTTAKYTKVDQSARVAAVLGLPTPRAA